MNEFDFTLKFSLPDLDTDPAVYVDHLVEAGCDDALIGIGQKGRIALNFCRESDSAMEAVMSAIHQVLSVIPGAQLIEASPDFVGLSDIARVLGCSRQNIRKIVELAAGAFPMPVHEGQPSLWRLHSVLSWFLAAKSRPISLSTLELAKVNMEINHAKMTAELEERPSEEIRQLFAHA